MRLHAAKQASPLSMATLKPMVVEFMSMAAGLAPTFAGLTSTLGGATPQGPDPRPQDHSGSRPEGNLNLAASSL